jgi:signal peptidase II
MLFIILIIFDQLTKYLIRWWGGFYICNLGISFGIVLPSFLFWLIWIILILSLFYYYFSQKKKSFATTLGLTFILSGAISNVLDRLFLGCVIDFINLQVWPLFNLADAFIFFGAIIILSATVKNKD